MENRPIGRKKNVAEGGSGVHKRDEVVGGGPVGNSNGYSGRGGSGAGSGPQRSSGGRSPLFMIIVALVLILGGGGGISSLLGGGLGGSDQYTDTTGQYPGNAGGSNGMTSGQSAGTTSQSTGTSGTGSQSSSGTSSSMDMIGSLLGGLSSYSGATSGASAAWSETPNTGKLNTQVASAARAKRTVIKGDGEDIVTIMVYMCGADLESRSGMASRDLQEMLAADIGDNVRPLSGFTIYKECA